MFSLLFAKSISSAIKTTLLLSEFSGVILKSDLPRPLLVTTSPPQVKKINIKTRNGDLAADLYLPSNIKGRRPATIFMFGLTDTFYGPDMVRLSQALARLGIIVLAPHLSVVSENRIVDERVRDDIVDSFMYLEKSDFVDKERIGFMTFCIGGSHALVAAANPKIKDKVAYVQTIAPFYDLTSFGKAAFAGQYLLDENAVAWNANARTRYVFRKEFLSLVPPEEQSIIYDGIWERHISDEKQSLLSEEGKIIWELFNTKDPKRVDSLVDKIDLLNKDRHDSYSPSMHVKDINAPVLIATGIADKYIPISESIKLADKLGREGKRVYFARLDLLDHGIPSNQLPLRIFMQDLSELWLYIYNVMLVAS